MKNIAATILLLATAGICSAQQWEFGGVGGAGFLSNVNVSSPLGSAKAGFQPGVVVGAFFGQTMGSHFAGQVRYEFMQSNLQLSSNGTTANFSANTHAVHYDLIWHTNREERAVQYFAVVGGGMKVFNGTGAESAYQPLSQFGYFTRTHEVKPMVTFGGGITYRLNERLFLRAEVRDFVTAFPTHVIAPAPNAKFGSLLQNIVPMVGIDYWF